MPEESVNCPPQVGGVGVVDTGGGMVVVGGGVVVVGGGVVVAGDGGSLGIMVPGVGF